MNKTKKRKKVMPPYLMLMWLNPTARIKPMDVAKQGFSKAKTKKFRGRSKSIKRQEVTFFYCGKPNHKKSDCTKYKRYLVEGKVANRNGAAMTAECE
jgi:hypothetical protein